MKIIKVQTILTKETPLSKRESFLSLPYGSTVEDLLSFVTKTWGDELSAYLSHNGNDIPEQPHIARIMINGVDISSLGGMSTILNDGDGVQISPVSSDD